ncbi:MAG: NAD(P)-dependent oxidoreductase [Halobacteriota archaeon]|uniref:NAD(P)-dependent oxidoreductase n=1 Tax=Natronomonas sp. TaxID=2184060 RepID=UPI0039754FAC
MVSVGFIGLGNMGGPMANHLLDAGHDLTVYDLDPDARAALEDAGAAVGEGPADVATHSEVVFLSLPTPEIVRAVVLGDDGVEAGIKAGAILVDTTTSTPGTTEDIAATLADREVTVLGAPVSGGASGARDGTLTTMVGGDPAAYEACEELFSAYAPNRYHVGDSPGDGNVVKLLNNYLSFLGMVGASEAVALGERAGLDPETMVDIFSRSTGRNAAVEDKFPNQIIPGRYDLGFSMALMHKDIRLFSQFAAESDAPVLLGDTVANMISYAKADLGGDADMSEVYKFVQQWIEPSDD